MYSSVNTIWVLFGTALVFFMQAGFSLCEAGFIRAKNTGILAGRIQTDVWKRFRNHWQL